MDSTDRLRPLVLMIAGNVLFATGLIFHAFLYNFYLESLHHPVAVMGFAAAALTGGGVVILLPAGALADRAGPKVALVVASVAVTVGLVLGAGVVTPTAVYGAAVLAGAGSGIWRVATGPILMRITEPRTRARAFAWTVGLLVGWSGVGTALAGAVSNSLEGRGLSRIAAIRAALVLGAAVSAGSIVLFNALKVPAAGAYRSEADPPIGPASPEPVSPLAIRKSLPRVGLVAVWMLGPALAAPFFNLFFSRKHGLSIEHVGFVFAAANLGWALAVLVSGEVAGRIGMRRLLTGIPLVFAPVMLGLSMVGRAELAVGLFFLQGMISPVINPLIDQWLLGQTPREHQGTVSGWRQMAADVSAMIGASLGGLLLAKDAFDALFLSAGAIGLVGAVGLILSVRATPWVRAPDG